MQSLNHPAIVKIEELVFGEKLIFLIMEYCPRGDLFSYIVRAEKLPDFVIKKILRQLLEALAYLHERKLAHRDIKPENILISIAGNAKLGDFGLCHSTSSQRLLTTPCGSPLYAPPEIITGKPYDGQNLTCGLLVLFYILCVQVHYHGLEQIRQNFFSKFVIKNTLFLFQCHMNTKILL